MIIGHLVKSGIIVQRARVRALIHCVDPVNTAIRRSITDMYIMWKGQIAYGTFHTHHKLIWWRFVIQGDIDGYSRTLVFLRCSDNNQAITDVSAFVDAVGHYGLPEKVRTDPGGENVDIW